MKHLITGGSGFAGNLMARHLLRVGETVRILDLWKDPSLPDDIEFIKGDILDRNITAKAVKGMDFVHHLAANLTVTRASKDIYYKVNAEGSRVVAEESAKACIQSFVYMSSSSIFGIPNKCPIDNDNTTFPVDDYGKSKLAGELAVKEVADRTGMVLIAIRPRTIIGNGRLGIFQILFEWIKDGANVYTIGKGENRTQFIHVDDLVSACLLLCKLGKPGFYNIGTDRFGTVRTTLEDLIKHAGSPSEVKALPEWLAIPVLSIIDKLNLSPLSPLHYMTYGQDFYCDITPLTNLGWKPKYSNVEMLCESYDQFIEQYDDLMAGKLEAAHRRPVNEKLLGLLKQFS